MKNLRNDLETNEISSQLERADLQKEILIQSIYKGYDLYLKILRDLLFISVKKGIDALLAESSIKNFTPTNVESFISYEKKISLFVSSQLPLITVEQLLINKNSKNINKEENLNSFAKFQKLKDSQENDFEYKDDFVFTEPIEFDINENICETNNEYYQNNNKDLSQSLDLDKRSQFSYLKDSQNMENFEKEKQLFTSLLELFEEDNFENEEDFINLEDHQINTSYKKQNLNNFDEIEKSLSNLLLNLSYKINLELFNSNLIKKIISEDSFKYLASKQFMIKHPHPFVMNFDLNINKLGKNVSKLPSISFFNINLVELEFKYLNLSIQRRKIKELKNQFHLLIKKEKYWNQKKISFNNMNREN